jgi:hypothetical protein
MQRLLVRRPSPAMVVALAALFVSLGGGAYAALSLPRNSVGSAQLKHGAVTRSKLGAGAVTSIKVKDHSLLAADFKAGQLPVGQRGPQGAKGDTGPPGQPGANGVSVTTQTLSSGDPNCPFGGARFTAANGVSYACDGAPGPTLARTVVVSPKDTASASGQALLDAIAGLSSASPSNPWLVFLEPGLYDLGSRQLTMQPGVVLAGSGEGFTTISSSIADDGGTPPPSATVLLAPGSELRDLTVVDTATTSDQFSQGVAVGTSDVESASYRLDRVEAESNVSGSGRAIALEVAASTLEVDDSTASASAADTTGAGWGAVVDGGTLLLRDGSLAGNANGGAIQTMPDGTAKISDSQVSGAVDAGTGTVLCAGAFDVAFQPLGASCT